MTRLKRSEVRRQFVLRDTSMEWEPGSHQRSVTALSSSRDPLRRPRRLAHRWGGDDPGRVTTRLGRLGNFGHLPG